MKRIVYFRTPFSSEAHKFFLRGAQRGLGRRLTDAKMMFLLMLDYERKSKVLK